MPEIKPLKLGDTGSEQFATGDSIPLVNGGVPTGGTTGQVLSKVSATNFDLTWSSVGGGSVATDVIWDAKGDLAAGTGANTAVRLAVGSDASQLYADASTATGLRWGPSVISPAQITADQDNYNPTGWANCQILRLSGDNGIRAITSLAATFSGNLKRLINVGSSAVYFPGEHPDGTAANRFTSLGKDFVMLPGKSAEILYDSTSSRWRFLGDVQYENEGRVFSYNFVPGSVTAADWGNVSFTVVNTGTTATVLATASLPAATAIGTSTNVAGGSSIGTGKTASNYSFFGASHNWVECAISIPTLSTGTETYEMNVALWTTGASAALNSASTSGIRYTHGTNTGKFQGFNRDGGGVESLLDTGITVAVNTLYVLRVEFDKSRTEGRFYIDGAFVGRITGNLPAAAACNPRVVIVKSVGTTARTVNVHRLSGGSYWA